MGKLTEKVKFRGLKKSSGSLMQFGMDVFHDSLSLIRKRRIPTCESHPPLPHASLQVKFSNHDDNPSTSIKVPDSGMATLCLIKDDGLDDGNSSTDDSDSSTEAVRDASFTSPVLFGVRDVPSVIVNKAGCSSARSILEDTNHLNIKHSTMNQSDMEAEMESMENLSPIGLTKAGKKKRRKKLLDVSNGALENAFSDTAMEPEIEQTGNTPRHVRKVMNKLRSVGAKQAKKYVSPPILDFNRNSMKFVSKVNGTDLQKASDKESSEEWSPSNMNGKPSLKKWFHPNEEEGAKTYLRYDVLPEWKRCIQKPLLDIEERSFRTSSPSPRASAKYSFARKTSGLQVSSIHGCDASIDFNFESCPRCTINSDEIAPFSSSSIRYTKTSPEIIVDPNQQDMQSKNEMREGVEAADNNDGPATTSLKASLDRAKGSSRHNCSVMSDEICHLPSPAVVYRKTGIIAPSMLDIPIEEICFSD